MTEGSRVGTRVLGPGVSVGSRVVDEETGIE